MRFVEPELDDPMKYPKAVRRAVAQQQQAVREAFREHNERLRPLLPPLLQQIQEANIHDARIRSLCIDAAQQTVDLCLTCCDTPGCFDLNLHYKAIRLTTQETSLLCLIAYEENAEIYWGELDIEEGAKPAVFIHRIVWQTRVPINRDREQGHTYMLTPEIELRFGDFEMEVIPNPEGDFSRSNDFITVVQEPGRSDAVVSRWFAL